MNFKKIIFIGICSSLCFAGDIFTERTIEVYDVKMEDLHNFEKDIENNSKKLNLVSKNTNAEYYSDIDDSYIEESTFAYSYKLKDNRIVFHNNLLKILNKNILASDLSDLEKSRIQYFLKLLKIDENVK